MITDTETWQCLRCDVWNDPGHVACQVCETHHDLAVDPTTLIPLTSVRSTPHPGRPVRTHRAATVVSRTPPPAPAVPPMEFHPPAAAPPPVRHHHPVHPPYRPPVPGPPGFPPQHQIPGTNKVWVVIALVFCGFYVLLILISALSSI